MRVIINKPKPPVNTRPSFLYRDIPVIRSIILASIHTDNWWISLATKAMWLRAEKPGMGDDSNTPDCADVDLNTEVKAFSTAYEKLKPTTMLTRLTYSFSGIRWVD